MLPKVSRFAHMYNSHAEQTGAQQSGLTHIRDEKPVSVIRVKLQLPAHAQQSSSDEEVRTDVSTLHIGLRAPPKEIIRLYCYTSSVPQRGVGRLKRLDTLTPARCTSTMTHTLYKFASSLLFFSTLNRLTYMLWSLRCPGHQCFTSSKTIPLAREVTLGSIRRVPAPPYCI